MWQRVCVICGVMLIIDVGAMEPPLYLGYRYEVGTNKVTIVDSVMYAGGSELKAINVRTGELMWEYKCGDRWYSSYTGTPTVVGDNLYVAGFDGNVYCFDRHRGKPLWVYETCGEIAGKVWYREGRLYFGAQMGVYCLDADEGGLIWRTEVDGSIYEATAMGDDMMYVGGTDGCVYGVRLEDGRIMWRVETGYKVDRAPAVDDGVLYVGTDKLYAVEGETGELIWTRQLGGMVETQPIVVDDKVVVGCDDGYVYAVDKNTGDEVWSCRIGDVPRGVPWGDGDIVYVGGLDKRVYGIDVGDGEIVWEYELDEYVDGEIIMVGDKLYVGAGNYIYEFTREKVVGVKYIEVNMDNKVRAGDTIEVKIKACNDGGKPWSEGDGFVCEWINRWGLVRGEEVMKLGQPVAVGDTVELCGKLKVPEVPGRYRVRVGFVHGGEKCRLPYECEVEVGVRTVVGELPARKYVPPAGYGFDGALKEMMNRGKAVMLVERRLKHELQSYIERYVDDVQRGWGMELDVYYGEWCTAEEVREMLRELYRCDTIAGAIMVGRIPVAMFEASYGRFPMALYYEDVEGRFEDTDGDGMYDKHYWGKEGRPQMWVSFVGTNGDVENIRYFFDKCHRYYEGEMVVPHRVLIYCGHNDYGCAAWEMAKIAGTIYGDNVIAVGNRWVFGDGETYLRLLQQPYEVVDVWGHAGPMLQQFDREPKRNVYEWWIRQVGQGGVITFIWGCSAGNFIYKESDYTIAEAYIMGRSMCTTVMAVTRGIGTDHEHVYKGLASGAYMGAAYYAEKVEKWATRRVYKSWPYEDTTGMVWGATLFGNPFVGIRSCEAKGRVTGSWWGDGKHGVKVRFVSDGRCEFEAETDEKGRFEYKVEPGEYEVMAVVEGDTIKQKVRVDDKWPNIVMVVGDEMRHRVDGVGLVSIPMQPRWSEVDSIFGGMKVMRWCGDRYMEVEYIEPGKGYVVVADTGGEIRVIGTLIDTGQPYVVGLDDGWNIIGGPFNMEVEWDSVEVEWVSWGKPIQRVGLDEAVQRGWIKPWLWQYKDGVYRMVDRMEPWRGYWVKATAVGYRAYGYPQLRIKGRQPMRELGEMEPEVCRWWIQMICERDGMRDCDNYVGVSELAEDGYDEYDVEKPPAPGWGRYVYVGMVEPTWGHNAGYYAWDIKADDGRCKVWTVCVKTEDKDTCVVSWRMKGVPKEYEVELKDCETGEVIDMREVKTYEVEIDKVRKFELRVGVNR